MASGYVNQYLSAYEEINTKSLHYGNVMQDPTIQSICCKFILMFDRLQKYCLLMNVTSLNGILKCVNSKKKNMRKKNADFLAKQFMFMH